MCICARPVISVNNTQIFARLSGKGTQFLAYQMNIESEVPNAMILPVPIKQPAQEDYLRFIDLKNYDAFFDDLANGFPYQRPFFAVGCSSNPDLTKRSGLQVFEVGNYIASFVPTIADFDRLDAQFRLPQETWNKIPGYGKMGFAVFQLASGSLKPHPMALEFQTANTSLFFPTVHIHDGTVHEREHFDHILYMQHAGLDSKAYGYQNAHIKDKSTGLIRSQFPAAQFCNVAKASGMVLENLLVHRKFMQGDFLNKDTLFYPSGHPVTPSLNLRPWMNYAPWLVGVAAIAWFFNRRSRLKHRKAELTTHVDETTT